MRVLLPFIALFFSSASVGQTDCGQVYSDSELIAFKASQFNVEPPHTIEDVVLKLRLCVGHPNPKIRDEIVYQAFQFWLREDKIDDAHKRQLIHTFLANMEKYDEDQEKYLSSFSVLILAEVVRVDRISPYLTDGERQHLVSSTASFIEQIDDYRGFSDTEGWRHLVAHAADVVLQLALNPQLSSPQAELLLDALISQISPKGHFYRFSEPKRLALPIVYLFLRKKIDKKMLLERLSRLVSPEPFQSWDGMFQSENGLAKIHNTTQFFTTFYTLISTSKNDDLIALVPELSQLLKQLP